MGTHSVAEAKNRLPELIDRALKGEGVVITRHGRPVVELKPITEAPRRVTAADVDWLQQAEAEERVIFTSDKDFGELIFRDHLNTHGAILLRLPDLTLAERIDRLQSVWDVIEANPKGSFIVVTLQKVRVRPLGSPPDAPEAPSADRGRRSPSRAEYRPPFATSARFA